MVWLDYDENYSLSCYGEVKNKKTGRILKPWDRGKYLAVNIGANNKKVLHKLIAEMFLPKINTIGLEIDHIDRNKHNNSAYNLRWVSRSINALNKEITTKPQKNNSINEHHIIFNNHSYYVVISKQDLYVRNKYKTLSEAINQRNKIIENYKNAV